MQEKAKTIKEAILKSLEDFPKGAKAKDTYQNILDKEIFTFNPEAKTPDDTVGALLGDLYRANDPRVTRFREREKAPFKYILTKFLEENGNLRREEVARVSKNERELKALSTDKKVETAKYKERDLHKLFCTFLKKKLQIDAKTIFHEKSIKTEHQKWTHPDIVGVKFNEFRNNICQSFFKAMNKQSYADIYSFELKQKISTDYELKQYFFQAVSNSSWANYGYLVALRIEKNMESELERLNNSFGIGVIQLDGNALQSRILFQAKRKEIDFNTLDTLCINNPNIGEFLEKVCNVLQSQEKLRDALKKDLRDGCDPIFDTPDEMEAYCKQHDIPYTNEK